MSVRSLSSMEALPFGKITKWKTTYVDPVNGHIFCQLSEPSVAAKYERMEEGIKFLVNSNMLEKRILDPVIGELCLGQSSINKAWYRSQIIYVEKTIRHVEVFFLDIGINDFISYDSLRDLPPQFFDIPAFAHECMLADIEPVLNNNKWNESAIELIKKQLLDKEVAGIAVRLYSRNILVIKLYTNLDALVTLADQLISTGFALPKPIKSSIESVGYIKQHSSSNSASNSIPGSMKSVKSVIPMFSEISPQKRIDVYVVFFQSLNEFYCQSTSSKEKLFNLQEQLQCVNVRNNLTIFETDQPCCAKFSEDNQWYRGLIKSTQINTCDIFFVDYGNTEVINKTDIKELNPDFCAIPSMAFCCSLSGIKPLETETKYSEEANFLFQKLAFTEYSLSALIMHISEQSTDVILYDNKNNPINQMLVNEKLVAATGMPTLEKANQSLSSQSIGFKSNVESVISFISPNIEIGKEETVFIITSFSPNKFFVHLSHSSEKLLRLMSDIKTVYKNSENTDLIANPVVGLQCVTTFSEDDEYYRAEIQKVDKNECQVFFVDYGNSESKALNELKPLRKEFIKLPKQAVECRLAGIKPLNGTSQMFSQAACEKFEELTMDKELLMNVLDFSDGVYSVELYEFSNSHNVINQLISSGLVAKTTQKKDYGKAVSIGYDYKELNIDVNSYFDVVPVNVVNPNLFYCHVVQNALEFKKLTETINEFYQSKDFVDQNVSWKEKMPCVALFSEDQTWCRASIISTNQNLFEVLYVDYGNTGTVSNTNLFPIYEEFIKLPVQVFPCSLVDILPIQSSWHMEAIESFQNFVLDKHLGAFVKEKCNNIYSIVLYDTRSSPEINLSQWLLQNNYAVTSDNSISNIVPSNIEKIYVTAAVSSTELYAQLERMKNDLHELMNNINNFYSNLKPAEMSISTPMIGQYCCAKFTEDDVWYRAVVEKLNGNIVGVLYIDYGNREYLSVSRIKRLESSFLPFPKYALFCHASLDTAELLDKVLSVEFITKSVPFEIKLNEADYQELLINNDRVSLKNIVELPPISIAVGRYEAICYAVESATKINCQLTNFLCDIDKIMYEIATVADLAPVLSNPVIGQLCLAKYCVDESWYRGRVVSTEKDIVVEFIDFGNKDAVPLKDIRVFPEIFANVPQAYVSVVLHDVSILDIDVVATKKWLEISFLEAILQLEVQEVLDATTVSAFVFENGKSEHINDQVYELHALPENISNSLQEQAAVLPPPFISDVTNSSNISLPPIGIAVGRYEAICYAVESATKINCQLTKFLCDIDRIMHEIAVVADSLSVLSNPVIGQLCLAKYCVDESWYRGRVVSTEKDIVVEFIDFGNKDAVPLKDIRVFPEIFANVPQAYVSVVLHDVSILDIDVVATKKWLEISFLEAILQLEVQEVLDATTVSAFVFENGKSEHINDQVYELHALPENISNSLQEQAAVLPPPFISDVTNSSNISLPPIGIAVGRYEAICYAVESATKINCQLTKFLCDIDRIMHEIAVVADSLSVLSNPVIGQLCLAKYCVDESWYRGRVVSTEKDIVVEFIDFGNKDAVPLKDIRVFPEIFANVPQAYVSVVLHDVSILDIDVVATKKWLEISFLEAILQLEVQEVLDATTVSAFVFENGKSEHINDQVYELHALPENISNSLQEQAAVLPPPFISDVTNSSNISLPPIGIAVGRYEAICYAVESATKINCQLTKFLCDIDRIMHEIAVVADSLSVLSNPVIGQLCLAKYCVDESWYRGRVVSTEKDIVVEFIDFGNKDAVPLKDIRVFPEIFANVPQAYVSVVLHDVSILDINVVATKKWLEISFLEAILQLEVQEVLDATTVSAFVFENGKSEHINDQVYELHALPENISNSLQEQAAVLPPPFISDVTNSSNISLPPIGIAVGRYEAICYAVESATKINCQLTKFLCDIDRIMHEIAVVADSLSVLSNPVIGQLCLAKYCVDESWYRGRVVSTEKDIVVEFIDFGNKDAVPLKDIRVFPEIFANVPQAYVSVVLHDVSILDIDVVATKKWLEISFLEAILQLEVQEVLDATTVSAYVFENGKSEHINDQVYELHALPENISNSLQEQAAVLPPPFISDVTNSSNISLPPIGIAVGRYEAICYAVESATKINCQLTKFLCDIDRIMQEIAVVADSLSVLSNPVIGQLCLAKYCVDESWYRGRVVSTEKDIVVEFIDFGNKDAVPLKDIRVFPEIFANVPQAYVSVVLHDVNILDIDVVATKMWLEASFLEAILQLEVQEVLDTTTVSAFVFENGKPEHINDQVYELHALPENSSNSFQEQTTILSPTILNVTGSSNISLPPISIAAGRYEAICYAVESATKINCQLTKFLCDIDRIMHEIAVVADSLSVLSNPVIGQLCLAKYCVDESWYRGRVVSTEKDIVVEFIDFGNKDAVPLKDIRVFPEIFANVPQAYVSVVLHDVNILDIDVVATKMWLEASFLEAILQLEVQEVLDATTVSAYVFENGKSEHINDQVYELHAYS
ncbi:uncharacterized protein LOC100210185 [Hydra vulgaris]|uniref:Uncharacterized protein LOC100210185 n=1 Tax=Hydra vulgaris TaxID=6087 RepID=A0ABM4D8N6_HYDVU